MQGVVDPFPHSSALPPHWPCTQPPILSQAVLFQYGKQTPERLLSAFCESAKNMEVLLAGMAAWYDLSCGSISWAKKQHPNKQTIWGEARCEQQGDKDGSSHSP